MYFFFLLPWYVGKMPYRENQQVAIVHARRTDKEDDKMPYWYFTKYNLTGGFQSMVQNEPFFSSSYIR